MSDTDLFWVSIIGFSLAMVLVGIDWYVMHRRYAFSGVPNIVNRVFAFFCLAMLTSNVIMVSRADYHTSLYVSAVVTLTELLFLCTNKVKQ